MLASKPVYLGWGKAHFQCPQDSMANPNASTWIGMKYLALASRINCKCRFIAVTRFCLPASGLDNLLTDPRLAKVLSALRQGGRSSGVSWVCGLQFLGQEFRGCGPSAGSISCPAQTDFQMRARSKAYELTYSRAIMSKGPRFSFSLSAREEEAV